MKFVDRKQCKWTKSENARLLTQKLEKIAQNLSFTQGKNVVIKLFLKHKPKESQGNHLLAKDVIRLMA